jgi:hypothetical protein
MTGKDHDKPKNIIYIVTSIIGFLTFLFIYINQNNQVTDLKHQVRELQTILDDAKEEKALLVQLLISKTSSGDITISDLTKYLSPEQAQAIVEKAGIEIRTNLPFDLETQFVPSNWMGDGEFGVQCVILTHVSIDVRGNQKVVTRLEYRPGTKGWAGIYWVYPGGNWGDEPGKSLIGASKITFLARGEYGGEIVEFKIGGIRGKTYEDTSEVSTGKVKLSTEWQEYTIDLSNQDLSNVIGAFAWIVAASDNENKTVTAYIANLVIDK